MSNFNTSILQLTIVEKVESLRETLNRQRQFLLLRHFLEKAQNFIQIADKSGYLHRRFVIRQFILKFWLFLKTPSGSEIGIALRVS